MMDRIEVYKSEYLDWRRSKVTKALVQDILHKREALKEGWAEGHLEKEETDKGRCQGMKDIIDYIVDGFEVVDDQQPEEKEQ